MCCDRISELPDSLLTHILSYLSTKDSVKTSVLSKRWELLWLKVSGLDINTMDFRPYDGEPLLSFMERFLEFNRGSCLETFKIKYCRYAEREDESCIRLVEWIPELIRRGVQHLVLENKICPGGLDIMPNCIYMSKTLEASIEDWIDWTNVPQCLSSTLKYVKIGVNIMMTEAGIKLANYFLENSAVLKKLCLSCKYYCRDKREAEKYKKLLTSTKLSPRCQVLVC